MPSPTRLLHRIRGRNGNTRTAAPLLLLAASGLAVAAVGVAVVARSGDASSDRVTVAADTDRAVNRTRASIDAHNSPTLAQNPRNPTELAIADKVDRPDFGAALHISSDAGRTWDEVAFPTPRGQDRPYAPDLAWSADGSLHMAFVTLAGKGNSPGAVWTTTSTDSGRSWARPRRVLGPYAFQVRLAAAPKGRILYLTWLQANEDAISCVNCFSETGLPILASRSSDGGASWGKPARVSSPSRERVGAPASAVSQSGELYVLYYDFKDDRLLWQNLKGPPFAGNYELALSRGTADARGFRETVVEPAVAPDGKFLIYLPRSPSLALGPNQTLYAAWADPRAGDRDVFIRRSPDGGRSWSRALRVNPVKRADQYLPQVAVAPGGRVDVAYLDRRHDRRDRLTAAYYATSYDRGSSWSAIALSTTLFDATTGPHNVLRGARDPEADQGTRLGLVSGKNDVFAAWTAADRTGSATGKLNIRFARVKFSGK